MLARVLEAKKQEINQKLRASRRRREKHKGDESYPVVPCEDKRASISSYKEALLGNPLDCPAPQNNPSPFSSQCSLNFKTSDYSTSALSLNPSKDTLKSKDEDNDSYLQQTFKEYTAQYIDVNFSDSASTQYDKGTAQFDYDKIAQDAAKSVNNKDIKTLEMSSVDIFALKSYEERKEFADRTYQELLNTLESLDENEYAKTSEKPTTHENSKSLEKVPKQHSSNEEASKGSFIDSLSFFDGSKDSKQYGRPAHTEVSSNHQIQNGGFTSLDIANEKIMTLNIDLEQQNKTIQSLIEAVNLQRTKNNDLHNEMSSAIQKLNEQHEEVTEKHLSFIDELLTDKKELQDKCEKLNSKLSIVKKENEEKLRNVEEKSKKQSRLNKLTQQVEKVGKCLKKNFEIVFDNELEEQIKTMYDNELEELSRRYKKSIQLLRDKLKEENSAWEINLMKYCNFIDLEENEEQIDQLRKSKDEKVEEAINRVEKEINFFLIESEKSALEQYRRLYFHHEADMRDQCKAYDDVQQKYVAMKQELNSMEAYTNTLTVTIRQNRTEMDRMSDLLQTVESERKMLKDQMGEQFTSKLKEMELANEKLRMQITSAQSQHDEHLLDTEDKIKEIQESKEAELENIRQKVQSIISKKDDSVANLQAQCDAANKRAAHLEVLLDKQREELVFK